MLFPSEVLSASHYQHLAMKTFPFDNVLIHVLFSLNLVKNKLKRTQIFLEKHLTHSYTSSSESNKHITLHCKDSHRPNKHMAWVRHTYSISTKSLALPTRWANQQTFTFTKQPLLLRHTGSAANPPHNSHLKPIRFNLRLSEFRGMLERKLKQVNLYTCLLIFSPSKKHSQLIPCLHHYMTHLLWMKVRTQTDDYNSRHASMQVRYAFVITDIGHMHVGEHAYFLPDCTGIVSSNIQRRERTAAGICEVTSCLPNTPPSVVSGGWLMWATQDSPPGSPLGQGVSREKDHGCAGERRWLHTVYVFRCPTFLATFYSSKSIWMINI